MWFGDILRCCLLMAYNINRMNICHFLFTLFNSLIGVRAINTVRLSTFHQICIWHKHWKNNSSDLSNTEKYIMWMYSSHCVDVAYHAFAQPRKRQHTDSKLYELHFCALMQRKVCAQESSQPECRFDHRAK